MRPYLLISNDDGVEAPGINFLIETLRPYADILVMSPDSARSGFSCSITSTNPITYKVLRQEEGLTVCSCSGTPTDCVKMALNLFTDRPQVRPRNRRHQPRRQLVRQCPLLWHNGSCHRRCPTRLPLYSLLTLRLELGSQLRAATPLLGRLYV